MAGFIILEEGRARAPSAAAYDEVIGATAEALGATEEERSLASWLRTRTCLQLGPGMGYVDVRDLEASQRQLFVCAIRSALRRETAAAVWLAVLLGKLEPLVNMLDAVDRGEPPEGMNDIVAVILWGADQQAGG